MVLWAVLAMVVVCGLVMYANYRVCDPIVNNQVEKGDQAGYNPNIIIIQGGSR